MADALPGILAIFNNVAPGREADFEEWFQHEHLAERIAVPGFLVGRRHEAIAGQPGYFNFYLTQSAQVVDSAAYLGRLDRGVPAGRPRRAMLRAQVLLRCRNSPQPAAFLM